MAISEKYYAMTSDEFRKMREYKIKRKELAESFPTTEEGFKAKQKAAEEYQRRFIDELE